MSRIQSNIELNNTITLMFMTQRSLIMVEIAYHILGYSKVSVNEAKYMITTSAEGKDRESLNVAKNQYNFKSIY